jgi:cytochrome b561
MAVGFGNEMVNTPIVLMWGNADGSVTLSQRKTSSYTMPTVDRAPPKVATLGETISTASASEFRFTVEAESETTQNIIYAFSREAPSSSAVDARITIHQEKGMLTLDLSKPLASNDDSPGVAGTVALTATQKLVVAHAVFCGLGFLFLLPSGVLLARFFRTFTPTWFKGHWSIQFAISGPVILIGFSLAIAAVAQKGSPHFSPGHKAWGLVLIVLYLVQCSLGSFIHFVKPKKQTTRPPQNYAHAVLGLFIIGVAFYQVRTGYTVAWPSSTGRATPEAVNLVWIIWLVLMVLLYVGGLAFLPKQWRQEKLSRISRHPSEEKHELNPRSY